MPKYNFKCNTCEEKVEVSMPMSKLKGHLETCKTCDKSMDQYVPSFSSRVSLSKEEMQEKAKSEAREIADKVRAGDQSLISQIYGEK